MLMTEQMLMKEEMVDDHVDQTRISFYLRTTKKRFFFPFIQK